MADYQKIASEFLQTKQQFEKMQKKFNAEKEEFYSAMDELFSEINVTGARDELNLDCYNWLHSGIEVSVKRISRTKVTYNMPLLHSILRSDWRKVIKRKYTITDIEGLTAYLRSCGVDAKKFKSFLSIEESVDEKALDQMLNIGYVRVENIRPAMKIEEVSRYYKITEV